MDEEFAILLFFFGISVTANVALLIGAFFSARRFRRLENRTFPPGDDRVERLEQVVDTMDARLEQLVRGQEFPGRV